ncbi:hypothetical protein DCC85_21705 [Paenibacillus sp. CAA11]|uniref:hypothetical protein n=1 Tax=Paenibacillus sp. CAA11 TaxID=1532905 RepID=UPI000D34BD92|nr:hypothetical protein [Paenibacillus sp. CAA11]AWB46525.1 hypothetical protein DCC85_21705 [Paenibacillus sp. CAA11]
MVLIIQIAAVLANIVLGVFAGAGIGVGLLFFLVGLPKSKSLKTTQGLLKLLKFVLPVAATLGIAFIYLAITFYSARLIGEHFVLSRPGTATEQALLGRQLLSLGIGQGVWFFVSIRWLLPPMIDKLGFNRKQLLAVIGGSILTILTGIIAMYNAAS